MTRHARPILLALLLPLGCTDEGAGDDEVGDAAWCDEVSEWDAQWVALEDEVLDLVNQRRSQGATCGSEAFSSTGPLAMDPALRCAARKHSLDMATRNYFSHDTPEGVNFSQRADSAEYDAFAIGENIAAGYPSASDVVTGWMGSDGHCRNIMNPQANEIGIGYAPADAAEFGSYWTQVFGRRE